MGLKFEAPLPVCRGIYAPQRVQHPLVDVLYVLGHAREFNKEHGEEEMAEQACLEQQVGRRGRGQQQLRTTSDVGQPASAGWCVCRWGRKP
jgi:hypothetical protein